MPLGEGIIKCTKCKASATAAARTGWVWDWKTGWRCPEHTEASKTLRDSAVLEAARARHPSSGGK